MSNIFIVFLIGASSFFLYGKDGWEYRPLLTDGMVYTNNLLCFCARATDFDVLEVAQRRPVFVDQMRGCTHVEDSSITVIGDVVSVDIVALSGFDVNRAMADHRLNAWGIYRIEISVRHVEKGQFSLRRFLFLARCDHENIFSREANRWLFYRGMTLRIGLNHTRSSAGDGFSIAGASPCVPYAPFVHAQVVDLESDEALHFSETLAPKKASSGDEEFPRLILRYDANDMVMFVSSRSITQLPYQPVYDYNAYSKLYVWASRDSPSYDYWKYSWLSESALGGESKVVFVPDIGGHGRHSKLP